MKCDKCGKDMKEETLFTSVNYSCNCGEDSWQTAEQMRDFLSPTDFPIKLRFKDADGSQGGIFVGDIDYFERCPKGRKFKVQRVYDPYIGMETVNLKSDGKEWIISQDSEDDGC